MKLYDPSLLPQEETDKQTDTDPLDLSTRPLPYRLKNWWYYHKWYVICGILLILMLWNIAGNMLGFWTKEPDLQIAYIGKMSLPDDTVSALEQAFAELTGDFNGDGEAIVKLNQYTLDLRSSDPQTASTNYTSEVRLMGDISACQSYFFLTDDPEALQQSFQLFAAPDGSAPDEADVSTADKVILWADSRTLADMPLGSYTIPLGENNITGDSQEFLSGLSLGRRYFASGKTVDSLSQCDALWKTIINSVSVEE
jgi:hypothetical protein